MNGWGWVWFWWLVFPASIGSFGLWFSSLNLRGATISRFSIFSALIFNHFFNYRLGEPFTLHIMIGGLCVVVALIAINYSPHHLS